MEKTSLNHGTPHVTQTHALIHLKRAITIRSVAQVGAEAFHWASENSKISKRELPEWKTTTRLATQSSNNQRLLQPEVLTTGGLITRGTYNQGSYNQGFLQPGVLQQGVLQPGVFQQGVLKPGVLTTRGLTIGGRTTRVLKPAVLTARGLTTGGLT